MRKVLVIGSGGAGKSVFASRLAARLQIDLIHLDALYWRPGWVETPKADWANTINGLVQREHWVMDGNYGATLARRVAACDTVVFLDLPRTRCIARVLKRRLQFHGRARPDMNAECPERFSWQFLVWIWNYPSQRKPAILALLARLRPDQRSLVFTSEAEIERFFESIT